MRQWRPPEQPFARLGWPQGTSAIPLALLALRRGHDDVVHAWTPAAAIAAAHSRRPSVLLFQGLLRAHDLDARPRLRNLVLRAARGCDVVVAYSRAAAAAFEEQTGIAARVINPGIRLDAFTAGGSRHPTPAIFCAADPDEPRKRIRLLVEAFAALRVRRPDAELWLIAPRDPALAGAPGVRTIEPGADPERLVGPYRSAWVTVLPSRDEAFGLVVVESLACGTPVVGMSDGGAVPAILETGSDVAVGAVAEPDPSALAAVLEEAIAAPPDAAVARACRLRAEDFPVERYAAQYEHLYEELTARTSR